MAYEFDPNETLTIIRNNEDTQLREALTRPPSKIMEKEQSRQRTDFIVIGVLSVLVTLIAIRLDGMEALMAFAAQYEDYEIDEIFTLLIVMSAAFGVFSWRRVMDLRDQIARRNKAEAKMRHLAMHDPLTGLPNRAMFARRLEREFARSDRDETRVAVLALDLDHFKQINDFYGHQVGDAVLVAAGQRIKETVRKMDTVARLSGDEFAVIQPQISRPDEPAALAARIVRALAEPFEVEGHNLVIGVSAGITMSCEERRTAEGLLRAADVAMYRSKSDGRATYTFFEPDMDAQLRERRDLEKALREALDNDQLEVHYQPLFTVQAQRLKGFEALIRWTHPTRGNIPPGDFIPIAEDIGLIPQIGEWVLAKACQAAATWPEELRVAVNVSPVQFKDLDLAERFKAIVVQSGLAPDRLEIEITESVIMANTEVVLKILNELKDIGIRIAMDDFGTGYSSLSYLKKFPFDKIKIDRSFVSDLDSNAEDAAIVRAVIAMGQSLGMVTLAEGVESSAQLSQLDAEGCQEAQGFLLGQPMPEADAAKLVASHRVDRANGESKTAADDSDANTAKPGA